MLGPAKPAAAGDHDVGFVQLGSGPLLDVAGQDLGGVLAPRSGTWTADTSAAPPPEGSAKKDLARTTKIQGCSPVKWALATLDPPKSACSERTSSPSTLSPTTLVMTGTVEQGRKPAGDVPPVVGGGDEDHVRAVPALHEGGDGCRHGHAGKGVADVPTSWTVVAP